MECGTRLHETGAGAGSRFDQPQPLTLAIVGNFIRKLPRKTAVRVGDTAMFCVELARPESSVHWLRNNEEVVVGGRIAITTEGTHHTLTISQCSLEDVGEVAFVAGGCQTSTQFFVSGKGLGRASPVEEVSFAIIHALGPALGPHVLSSLRKGVRAHVLQALALVPSDPQLFTALLHYGLPRHWHSGSLGSPSSHQPN